MVLNLYFRECPPVWMCKSLMLFGEILRLPHQPSGFLMGSDLLFFFSCLIYYHVQPSLVSTVIETAECDLIKADYEDIMTALPTGKLNE